MTLFLTLHKKWFDLIASGEKTNEYREMKPYWKTRLENKRYDDIYFRNGYQRDAPFMRVEFKGLRCEKSKNRYNIILGKILEIHN